MDAFAKVITHLHENFAECLSTEELAEMAGLSVGHYERRFRRAFGASPRQYLVRIRVEQAAKILLETDMTVSEVAHAGGFYDHAYFSRSFRKIMQLSPSQYRGR
ncbi:helix-turn-helix domain-containing protein [Roseiconus lacunae]|uniref:helix-turn-helix domain-containing protein n=1 Tax=Roseiconus lacunae TaxID=2605694 RepID=UPI001F285F1E|nr:helix-turn-helix transcriptional regulator [Roseiconus lacunae]